MMAFEGPFLAALIARLADAKYNLAAYGVAYSFALLSEAPVIMMLSASTALVKDYHSYLKLRNFNNMLIVFVTALLLIGLIPPLFDFLTLTLINLPKDVSELTHASLLILIPWPGAIAYRRFLQGILIVNNRTRMVSYGTMIRVLFMSATGFLLFTYGNLPGAYVGACALSAGVVAEVIATGIMCRPLLKRIREKQEIQSSLNYRDILSFYYPLALATLIGLGSHPIITFMIGHSRMALESLAVLPVINALVFIFRSVGLSYQEVGIALMGEKNQNFSLLKNFALKLALINFVILGLISYTPLAHFWFETVSGLTPILTEIALIPTYIMAVIPAFTVIISFQRAIQVNAKKTSAIKTATTIEVAGIASILFTCTYYFDLIGVTAAALAMLLGRLAANSYLYFTNKRML